MLFLYHFSALAQPTHVVALGLLNHCRPSISVLSKGDVYPKLPEFTQATVSSPIPRPLCRSHSIRRTLVRLSDCPAVFRSYDMI